MNRINLLIFLIYLIHKKLIKCLPSSVIDPIDNLIKIEFDLDNISTNDYIIKRNRYKPAGYQFIPRPDRTITNVKIEGRTVWLRRKSLFVSDIIIYFPNYEDIKYAINFLDSKGNVDSIHYYHKHSLHAVGIMDYYDAVITKWLYFKQKNIFDLNSPFDYRNDVTVIFESFDKVHRNAEVSMRGIKQMYEIYDGKNLVHRANKNEGIKKFIFSWKDGQKLLLKCQTDFFGVDFIYFKYNKDNNKWEKIDNDKYEQIYYDNDMILANEKLKEIGKNPDFNLNLVDIIYSNDQVENHRFIMGLPTIEITYLILQTIIDGNQSLLKGILENAKVYLFRGEYSFEMIEIIQHYFINKITGEVTNKVYDKTTARVRGLNYYYIKDNGKWSEVSQSIFFYRFKKLVLSNLERINRNLSEFKPEGYESELEINNELIEITDELKLIDNTERVETEELDISDEAVVLTRENLKPEHNDLQPNGDNNKSIRTVTRPSNVPNPKEKEWYQEQKPTSPKYRFSEPEPLDDYESKDNNKNERRKIFRLTRKQPKDDTKPLFEDTDYIKSVDSDSIKDEAEETIEDNEEEEESDEENAKKKIKGSFNTWSIMPLIIFMLI